MFAEASVVGFVMTSSSSPQRHGWKTQKLLIRALFRSPPTRRAAESSQGEQIWPAKPVPPGNRTVNTTWVKIFRVSVFGVY